MASALQLFQLTTHLGPRWVAFRAGYALQRKARWIERRMPQKGWDGLGESAPAKPIGLFQIAAASVGGGAMVEAEQILAGRFSLFSFHRTGARAVPCWHRSALTGGAEPEAVHWNRIGDSGKGDIKAIWEMSRFPWAWPLARAWRRTSDERYAEAFWLLFEDWMRHNPPNTGANWMCGQEAAFRLMAAAFGRHALANAAATTPERAAKFSAFVQATGARIAANLAYALSQKNNHGVSECAGLISAALLVPGPAARRWRQRGLGALRRQLEELVYPDGAFAQHSANYHRVMLHDCLWCVALLRAAGEEPPTWLLDPAKRALAFLDTLITESTGRVPLYGANDGANVLVLSDGDYLDFRPVVQAGYASLRGVRRFPPGPWDEAAEWLAGADALRTASTVARPQRFHARHGGCLLLRSGESRVFLRCPERFVHRPSQADLLHADIEIHGEPVAIDAGTFSYNSPGRFAGALKEAAVHNTIVVDGHEPMSKAGRFIYLPWPRGRAGWNASGDQFIARRHDGHSRTLSSPRSGEFLVRDEVAAEGRHVARMQWLLADLPYEFDEKRCQLRLETRRGGAMLTWRTAAPARVSLVRADPDSARGWWSPYYLHAAPALSLIVELEFENTTWLETRFGPAA